VNETLHRTFTVERRLPGSPRHAFRFWADPALKRAWTDCHADWTVLEDLFDFRDGGDEVKRWRMPGGQELSFRARYFDIEPARRIVYAFDMSVGAARQSVSLATVGLFAEGAETRMLFSEQIAFLGGEEALRARIDGTAEGFDRLVAVVEAALAGIH
jgi:uncharacterized protein YndB with AHSA1/START domain